MDLSLSLFYCIFIIFGFLRFDDIFMVFSQAVDWYTDLLLVDFDPACIQKKVKRIKSNIYIGTNI